MQKIVSAFKEYKDIETYCHVVELDEIEENKFNLNVSRYVDISDPEEPVDIQTTLHQRVELKKQIALLESELADNLRDIGFNANESGSSGCYILIRCSKWCCVWHSIADIR